MEGGGGVGGMGGAIEFLSVECDMIFEPDCDLETESHEGDDNNQLERVGGGGGGGEARSRLLNSCHLLGLGLDRSAPSETLPELEAPVPIDDLFKGRNVGVYRRSNPSEPFILIFDPNLQPKEEGKKGKDRLSNGDCSGPEENGEVEAGDDDDDDEEDCWSWGDEDNNNRPNGNGRRRQPIKCQVCHKEFHSRGRLVTHELTHLLPCPGPSPPCPVCGDVLPSRAALKIHVRRHFSGRTYQCPTCLQNHLSHTQLLMHQQAHSQTNISYTLTHPHHNQTHTHLSTVNAHDTDTPSSHTLICRPTLNLSSSTSLQTSTHTQTQHQTPLQVSPGLENSNDGQNKRKVKSQPSSVPSSSSSSVALPDLCCEICNITFATRAAFRSHRRGHRDRNRRRRRRRRHECPECGSQFWRSSALKKHRKAEHDV